MRIEDIKELNELVHQDKVIETKSNNIDIDNLLEDNKSFKIIKAVVEADKEVVVKSITNFIKHFNQQKNIEYLQHDTLAHQSYTKSLLLEVCINILHEPEILELILNYNILNREDRNNMITKIINHHAQYKIKKNIL